MSAFSDAETQLIGGADRGEAARSGAASRSSGTGHSGSERDALLRVAAAASGASALDEVLELAAEEARAVLGAASLSISRWDREADLIRTLVNVGDLGTGEVRFPLEETYPAEEYPLVGRMLRHQESYFNSLADPDCDPAARQVLEALGKACDVGVAIVVEGQVWGEIWATRGTGEAVFVESDARFLEQVAEGFAAAIGRAELFSQVTRLAYEDPLTGLPNRRALMDELDRVIGPPETHETIILMLCDLDELKRINDAEGHDAGDRALRAVAAALREAAALHGGLPVARLSGDEFCLLIDEPASTSPDQIWTEIGAKLRSHGDHHLSLSGGTARTSADVNSAAALLKAADQALYVAKREGGGRLCAAGERFISRPVSGPMADSDPIETVVAALANDLDGSLAGRTPLARLEAVAETLLEACGLESWGISIAPQGAGKLIEASIGDSEFPMTRMGPGGDEYALVDFPLTQAIVAAGSGCFVVERADPDADEAERRMLERFGFDSVIAAAAAHGDDAYLLELYGGPDVAPLHRLITPLRLLVRAAMPPLSGQS